MSKPDLNIISSPSAERMRRMVTEGFYDRSRIGLWMFEVMGREYDDMALWAQTIYLEAFPQTCTWSIAIWEWLYGIASDDSLTLEARRRQLLTKKLRRQAISPARIETMLSALTGVPVALQENIAPYTFAVRLDESALAASNLDKMYSLLRAIKPSHLSYRVSRIVEIFAAAENRYAFFLSSLLQSWYTIRNYTADVLLVKLDGLKQLDGSWILMVKRHGIDLRKFSAATYAIVNSGAVYLAPYQIMFAAHNVAAILFDAFRLLLTLQEFTKQQRPNILSTLLVKGFATRYKESISVALTIDNRWKLNGAVKLDGSRRFSYFEKEAL